MPRRKRQQFVPEADPVLEIIPPDDPETVMGRPSSYRPEFALVAKLVCQRGATDADLADLFEVNVRTINRWKACHPEFLEAMAKGKGAADDRVEDSLYHRAMGSEYEKAHPVKVKEIEYDENGKKKRETERVEVVMVKEVIPADTVAAIFWLKNRRSQLWRDVHKHEHGEAGAFDRLTDEELDARIKELNKALAPPGRRKQLDA